MPDQDDGTALAPERGPVATELGAVLLTERSLDELLELVVSLARRTIRGADGVSVSLSRDGRLLTSNSSDEVVRELDEVQYEHNRGPCVETIASGIGTSTVTVNGDARWPEFNAAASQRFITSVAALPLAVQDRTIGSINLYSGTIEHFAPEDLEVADLFARQASIVLANAVAFESSTALNKNLQEALITREVIGEAKGIIMAQTHCSPEEAFDQLRRESQQANRKLRVLAEELVQSVQHEPS